MEEHENQEPKNMGMGSYAKMFEPISNNNKKILIVDPEDEMVGELGNYPTK
ncbi:hypothetical protein [Cytobacillus horneckiae]|uniref:hypothetical protein n=1 Tax=Cytobacillus horneckiae TaxID=549687 RepID=UPI003D21DA9F